MGRPARPKARLQRKEKDGIKQVLSNVRIFGEKLRIVDAKEYVWGYLKDEPVIGFRWVSKTGWRVFLPFTIHCHQDLESVVEELRRAATCTRAMRQAWDKYMASRSEKNFLSYQGCLGALFMGMELPYEPDE